MGYFGRLEDKLKAQELRKQGLSYKEILQQITVSKDTLSRWCKEIELTPEQKVRLLQNKQFGQRKGSLVAAENKKKARVLRTEGFYNQAKQELGNISQRERFLLGLALYAGEGYKTDGRVGFVNSDPAMITFMMQWFLTSFNVPLERFRGAIWLHEGLDEQKAKEYWAALTGIPLTQFHKTYVVKVKSESKKIRKNIHQYGVFTIIISNAELHRKIMGWLSAIFSDKIATYSPVAQW